MRKIFSTIYPFLLLPILAACVQIKDKSKGSDEVPTRADHFVEATATPNKFVVHLSSVDGTSEIRRQNLTENQITATAVELSSSVDGLVDTTVTPGNKYRYQYFNAAGYVIKIAEVEIPRDLVIDHEVSLSQSPDWQNIYRVYFMNGGILTTNGNNVLLKAQLIYSDHGVIRTFAAGATASSGMNGRSGGVIRIFTQSAAVGDLAVELRGENGGAGSSGAALNSRNGSDGGSGGNTGNFYFDSISNNSLRVTHLMQAGASGVGGPGLPALGGCPAGARGRDECFSFPAGTNGRNGQDGQS